MKGHFIWLSSLCFSSLHSLNELPWLADVYACTLETGESYSRYRFVDNALTQPAYAYNNYVTDTAFSFTVNPDMEIEVGMDLARTPHQLYGFRSIFTSVKYRLLDDIAGDPLSLAVGFDVRAVGGRAVRDVSSPYASYMNYELFLALGKEFSHDENWISRGHLSLAVGIPNHGSLWNRMTAVLEERFLSSNIFKVFLLGYFGYGSQKNVDIDHFQGWGQIRHSSLDLGAGYRYSFAFWGDLGVSYAYRVFAQSYPQNTSTWEVRYTLPFSLL